MYSMGILTSMGTIVRSVIQLLTANETKSTQWKEARPYKQRNLKRILLGKDLTHGPSDARIKQQTLLPPFSR